MAMFLGGGGGHSGAFCELLREASPMSTRAKPDSSRTALPLARAEPGSDGSSASEVVSAPVHRKNSRELAGRVKCPYASMLRRQHSEDKPGMDLF